MKYNDSSDFQKLMDYDGPRMTVRDARLFMEREFNKHLIASLLMMLALSSCTMQHGSRMTSHPDGRVDKSNHLYASLGTKAKGLANSPDQSEALEIDDSVSARSAITAVGTMYSAGALLAGQESNNALEATRVSQAAKTDRTGIISGASVEKAKVQADVAKEALKVIP